MCPDKKMDSAKKESFFSSSGSLLFTLAFHVENDLFVIEMCYKENRFNREFVETFHRALDGVNTQWHALSGPNKSRAALTTISHGKFYSNGLDLESILNLSTGELPDRKKHFPRP